MSPAIVGMGPAVPRMILVNLAGGPGSGKSTSAAHLFSELKMEGVKAELVGEQAKDVVYDRTFTLFENQVLITGQQWQRILRLQKVGCEVAISDSPLIQGMMYVKDAPYYAELVTLVRKLETLVDPTFNVWIKRAKPYSTFGRYQSEDEAKGLDMTARSLIGKFWMEIDGNRHGVHVLVDALLPIIKAERTLTATVGVE